jgi:hypothetical protein
MGKVLVIIGGVCCLLAAFGVDLRPVDLFPLGAGIAFIGLAV